MRTKIFTILLVSAMLLSAAGCGNGNMSSELSSASVSTSIEQVEAHEFALTDLNGLISGVEDIAVIQGSENVDLLSLVEYDKNIITDVKVDTGELDFSTEGIGTVTYTIVADKDKLIKHLNLDEANVTGDTTFETSASIYIIRSDDTDFQTQHPDIPVYTSNNEVYSPATEEQVTVFNEPAADTQTQTADGAITQPNNNQSKPVVTGNGNSANTTSGSKNTPSTTTSSNNSTTTNKNTSTSTTTNSGAAPNTNSGTSNSSNKNNSTSSSTSSANAGTTNGNTGSNSNKGNSGSTTTGGNTSSGNTSKPSNPKPTHTHSYTSSVTKQPTCSSAGVRTYTCSCGNSYTESIPATGNHIWIELTNTVHHDEVGHYETKVVKDAYDEQIKERKPTCNRCGAYFDTVDEVGKHTIFEHPDAEGASYSVKTVVTGTKHHDAVTEEIWVVDKKAYDETVVTGYKCSVCGVTK